MTGKEIYRDMTQFWGKLFGINFALGVTTGITMRIQFGTNWSYYFALCRRYFRRTAGAGRADGLFPRSHAGGAFLFRLGKECRAVSI